jgi:hypothetical protein
VKRGGANQYVFAANNSISRLDPDGRRPMEDASFRPGYWPPREPRKSKGNDTEHVNAAEAIMSIRKQH